MRLPNCQELEQERQAAERAAINTIYYATSYLVEGRFRLEENADGNFYSDFWALAHGN